MTRQRLSVGLAATAICIIVLSGLTTPASTLASTQRAVPIAECEIDGFGLGDSVDQMREKFGEPERDSVVNSLLFEHPRREYEYDGMRIVFWKNGRSAMSFYVSSPVFRLPSGIGVGSDWMDVVEALGPGSLRSSGGPVHYSYRVIDSKGDYAPAWLRFTIDNEVVTSFSVVTTR